MLEKIKVAKLVPIMIAVFGVFYLAMGIFLPKGSEIWARLLSFAPYVFGPHVIVEAFVGMNKLKEKTTNNGE